MSSCIIEHFSSLQDPRIERHKRHHLIDIIVLTLSVVISGADGGEAIEDFGKEKLNWLRQYIALENGIPSHDCIAYVLSRVSPSGCRDCFMSWTQSVVGATHGEIIAVDGKTARGFRDHKNNGNPLHMVSAWYWANKRQMRSLTRLPPSPNCWRYLSSKVVLLPLMQWGVSE